MQKLYLSSDLTPCCSTSISENGDTERYTIYNEIDALYGGWLLTTKGDPVTLNSLEDAGDAEGIEKINALLSDGSTPWEVCDENDLNYINEWLTLWGINT